MVFFSSINLRGIIQFEISSLIKQARARKVSDDSGPKEKFFLLLRFFSLFLLLGSPGVTCAHRNITLARLHARAVALLTPNHSTLLSTFGLHKLILILPAGILAGEAERKHIGPTVLGTFSTKFTILLKKNLAWNGNRGSQI